MKEEDHDMRESKGCMYGVHYLIVVIIYTALFLLLINY